MYSCVLLLLLERESIPPTDLQGDVSRRRAPDPVQRKLAASGPNRLCVGWRVQPREAGG